MLQVIWSLAALVGVAAVYLFAVRPRLRNRPDLKEFYDRLEAAEVGFWTCLNARLSGYRTMIIGAIGEVILAVPDMLPQLGGVNWAELIGQGPAKYISQAIILAMIFTNAVRKGRIGEKVG